MAQVQWFPQPSGRACVWLEQKNQLADQPGQEWPWRLDCGSAGGILNCPPLAESSGPVEGLAVADQSGSWVTGEMLSVTLFLVEILYQPCLALCGFLVYLFAFSVALEMEHRVSSQAGVLPWDIPPNPTDSLFVAPHNSMGGGQWTPVPCKLILTSSS